MQTNPELQLAFDFVQYTGRNIFLTGKAGTGKTTFLRNLRATSTKRMVVVAPTGVAAINAHGVTIHSFFQLPFGPIVGNERLREQLRFNKEKINIIKSLELLVIDEISMVRADLLDAIDSVLRRYRDRSKSFGGVQLLMIGDLQQLAPVIKDNEWEMLRQTYDTVYFFSSRALRETSFVSVELQQVFRQQDDSFLSILNKVRENCIDNTTLQILNQRYVPNFQPREEEGYITLCTHNNQAQKINDSKLDALSTPKKTFKAEIKGNFPEYSYPTDAELILKEGAQVMFVKNDPSRDKLFFNGKIGKIIEITNDEIFVKCPDDDFPITVTPLEWENVKYTLNPTTNEITEEVEGSFRQFPLKLAWAITIHKSQGLTFERAIIDAASSFAHGQVYVALSRCKTLEGMVLNTPIRTYSIINDNTVKSFTQYVEQNRPDREQLNTARIAYQRELLQEMFRFDAMKNRVANVQRVLDENRGSIPNFTYEHFNKIHLPLKMYIIDVADKFQQQIGVLLSAQPDVEQNSVLQERIVKSVPYFSDKIQSILAETLEKTDFEIDNKAIRKQLTEAVSRLEEEVRVKADSIFACRDGFSLAALQKAKAIAVIDKEKEKAANKEKKQHEQKELYEKRGKKAAETDLSDLPNPKLFYKLRSWRLEKSEEKSVPPFAVFSQKALYELVTYLPTDKRSLLNINGFGNIKMHQFGDEVVEIIKNYCIENGITSTLPIPEKEVKKPVKTAVAPQPLFREDTKKISYNLYKEGKSVADIVAERGLAATTIESHLAYYIGLGELDIHDFVSDEKIQVISDYFNKVEDNGLTAARETLGEEYSYGELRMVRDWLKKE
ncbi:MAG: helix-turn-helix domain-containing protein [Prevotellaceae bacterium]|jgi:hypothetical protein|nr:helix-turn-helix domain-containing protein [Prevotellaceae bacterium]